VAFEQLERCGRRHGQEAMRGANGPVTRAKRAAAHLFDPQFGKPPHCTNHVENRVHRANFVQVHLLRRQAVDLALSRGDGEEHCIGTFSHGRRRATLRHQLANFVDVPAVRLLRYVEIHLPADQLSPQHLANVRSHARQAESPR
jgi:hypothetical protein